MSVTTGEASAATAGRRSFPRAALGAAPGRRALLAIIVVLALVAGSLATDGDTAARAVSEAGPDLTRLLRLMAVLKGAMAAAALGAIAWRLGSAITPMRLAAYALAGAAMTAGPVLIWDMAQVGTGALMLHAGLAAALLLLWRDPAIDLRLSALLSRR